MRFEALVLAGLVLLAMPDFGLKRRQRIAGPREGKLATIYSSQLSTSCRSGVWNALFNGKNAYASSTDVDTGDADSIDSIPPGYLKDPARSSALTTHLQKTRLPLVRAQVFTNGSGDRQIILYGFVATERGRQNATIRTRQYLRDPAAIVINRIAVRPELLTSGSGVAGSSSAPPSTDVYDGDLGTAQSYQEQSQEAQRQQENLQRQQELNAVLLLVRILAGLL